MMRVLVYSPGSDTIELLLPSGIPCTLDTIRTYLSAKIRLNTHNSLFFHHSCLVTRTTILTAPPETNCLSITHIDKSTFPEKSFPRADFSFAIDHPLFRSGTNDFPEAEVPSYIRSTRPRANVQDLVEDVARYLSGPLSGVIPPPQYDYREPDPPRRSRFRPNRMDITGEELDEEEEKNEEEDVDGIIEMRDSFEENLSPENEAAVDRLTALGFDRNFVTPVLFMCHGDERVAAEFLTRAREVAP
jgi:hypothetical protein